MTIYIPEESSEAVKSTLQREIKRLKQKVSSLDDQLSLYEEKFGFSSNEFIVKFENGELGDDEVFFEWFADIETRNRIAQKITLLVKVKLDE